MRDKLPNKPDPKNNDNLNIGNYFIYEEAGFKGEWQLYNNIEEAIKNAGSSDIYIAFKLNRDALAQERYRYKLKSRYYEKKRKTSDQRDL